MAATMTVALLLGARAWAEPATGTFSGADCPGIADANTGALADLGAAVTAAELARKNCIPEGDPRRPFAEENERRALENRFGEFVRSICEGRICVNNGWGFVLDSFDENAYDEKTLMAGCGRWAGAVAASTGEAKPKYWEIREAQYGKGSGRPGYHWVVELRNARTGEVFLLDGYEASKSGRNMLGSNMTDSSKVRRAGERVVRAVFVGEGSPLASWFDQAEKMEGWPVRIERVSPGRRMRIELTKSERTLVDPAIFRAPGTGYTRVSDPSGFTLVAPTPASR